MSSEFLDPIEWMHYATQLPVGGRKRAPHDCGEGNPLLITRQADSITAWCFRCGGKGFHREHESLADKLIRTKQEREADDLARGTIELPEPRLYDTKDWPLADKVWFFKMGLSLSMIGKLGLYWCPPLGRVVLPITAGEQLVFWQARSQTRAPKWIAPDVPKQGLTARFGVGKGDLIVLTEDALSAFKVGLVTESWSLLGTKLHPGVLKQLVKDGRRVAIWLDDDKGRENGRNPGQEAAAQIGARLRAFGIPYHNIVSEKDPKYYNDDDIRRMIQ